MAETSRCINFGSSPSFCNFSTAFLPLSASRAEEQPHTLTHTHTHVELLAIIIQVSVHALTRKNNYSIKHFAELPYSFITKSSVSPSDLFTSSVGHYCRECNLALLTNATLGPDLMEAMRWRDLSLLQTGAAATIV